MDRSHQSNQQRSADPVYRKLHRAFLALCIVLAPLILSCWFGSARREPTTRPARIWGARSPFLRPFAR